MSTITKEQAQKIIEAADDAIHAIEGVRDDIYEFSDKLSKALDNLNDDAAPPVVVKRLAEITLASLGAEPVITVGDDGGDALAYRRLIQTFAPGTKLYTAPPVPVSVPDDLAGKSFEHIANKFQVSMSEAQWILVGWNAFRTAMLQGDKS